MQNPHPSSHRFGPFSILPHITQAHKPLCIIPLKNAVTGQATFPHQLGWTITPEQLRMHSYYNYTPVHRLITPYFTSASSLNAPHPPSAPHPSPIAPEKSPSPFFAARAITMLEVCTSSVVTSWGNNYLIQQAEQSTKPTPQKTPGTAFHGTLPRIAFAYAKYDLVLEASATCKKWIQPQVAHPVLQEICTKVPLSLAASFVFAPVEAAQQHQYKQVLAGETPPALHVIVREHCQSITRFKTLYAGSLAISLRSCIGITGVYASSAQAKLSFPNNPYIETAVTFFLGLSLTVPINTVLSNAIVAQRNHPEHNLRTTLWQLRNERRLFTGLRQGLIINAAMFLSYLLASHARKALTQSQQVSSAEPCIVTASECLAQPVYSATTTGPSPR